MNLRRRALIHVVAGWMILAAVTAGAGVATLTAPEPVSAAEPVRLPLQLHR